MPELPEVETVKTALSNLAKGLTILDVVIARRDLRKEIPANFEDKVKGGTIKNIDRRGKYILIHLDSGYGICPHLRMSGVIGFQKDNKDYSPGLHDHLQMRLDNGDIFVFTDPRRFGQVFHYNQTKEDLAEIFGHMGPEPLSDDFSPSYLSKALSNRRGPVKNALMDQKIVAGLGNIYVCEALFEARISPRRKAYTIKGNRARKLVSAIRNVLNRAIKAGGTTLRDYRQVNGQMGYFQHSFSVYDRQGRPCPGCICEAKQNSLEDNLLNKTGIHRMVQAGRSTFFCPKRQR